MNLNIKKLNKHAIIPSKAHETDAGFDLFVCQPSINITANSCHLIQTGVAIEIPYGCVGIIKDRSSLSLQGIHVLGGVIDYGYTGEILVNLMNLNNYVFEIKDEQKIAQLLIIQLAPIAYITEVEELSKSERGEKGFGSSDRKNVNRNHFATCLQLIDIGLPCTCDKEKNNETTI